MNDKNSLAEMETLFMALADKTRLRLLNLMREDEVCVYFFVEILGESQPKISRHLAYLRNAGIVETRRDGKWIHYKIIEPENTNAAQVLQNTLDWLNSQEEMQTEYRTLTEMCHSPTTPINFLRYPEPETFVKANMKCEENERRKELETFLL